jgi:hypothetical protein
LGAAGNPIEANRGPSDRTVQGYAVDLRTVGG